MRRLLSGAVVVVVAAMILSGCGADDEAGTAIGTVADEPAANDREADGVAPGPTPMTVDQVPSSPVEDVTSALTSPDADDLPPPTIDLAELQAGGPPPDGIPAIDAPSFLSAADVDFLADD